MNLRRLKSLFWLLIVQLFVAGICMAKLELHNDESDSEEIFEDARSSFDDDPPTSKPKISNENRAKTDSKFYAKVEEIFKKLSVCDVPKLQLDSVQIPNNLERLMKALKAIKDKNMLKKEDLARYELVMSNCKKLQVVMISNKIASELSEDDQYSGGTYDERLERLKDCPGTKPSRSEIKAKAKIVRGSLGMKKGPAVKMPRRQQPDLTRLVISTPRIKSSFLRPAVTHIVLTPARKERESINKFHRFFW